MEQFMQKLKENVTVGIVGGSDYKKITEQLGLVWLLVFMGLGWLLFYFSSPVDAKKKISFTVVFNSFLNMCVRDRC